MPSARRGGVWAGRVVFVVIVAGLVGHLVTVGLDKADKLASTIGMVAALAALTAPYLLPVPRSKAGPGMDADTVEDSGTAEATGGGRAGTGVDVVGDDRPARVARSGDATAHGPGSVADTGVRRRPRP